MSLNENNNDVESQMDQLSRGSSPVYRRLEILDPNRFLNSLLWFFTKLAVGMLLISATLIIMWRWMTYAAKRATRATLSHLSNVYSLLDFLSPSETEEEKQEKHEQMQTRIRESLVMPDFWTLVPEIDINWAIIAFGGMTLSVGLYYSTKAFLRVSTRAVHRMRGIQYESIRAGSPFRNSVVPGYQVAIMEAGLLTDKHIGYGIRYNDYLITPRHVLEKDGALQTEVLLSGPKAKLLTVVDPVQSREVDDLVYCYLDQKSWSLLGAGKAKLHNRAVSTHVTCTGSVGQSVGRVSKTAVQWFMCYTGSTVPGMSGAAYDWQGTVVGIHQGATGSHNLGLSSVLLRAEMELLVKVEFTRDSNPGEDDAVENATTRFIGSNRNVWNELRGVKGLEDKYYGSAWDRAEDEVDYNAKLDFGEESARSRKSARKALNVALPEGGIRLAAQGAEEQELYMAVATKRDLEYASTLYAENVLERLEKLERYVQEHIASKIAPIKQAHSCVACKTVCRTAERLEKHVINSHKQPVAQPESARLVKESAIPSDTGKSGKVIRQGAFLEKRSSSLKSNVKNSSRSSSRLNGSRRSPSREENLSNLASSQKNIENLLKKLLEVTAGRNSATTQN